MTDKTNCNAAVIRDLAARAAAREQVDVVGVPHLLLEPGQTLKSMETLLHRPARVRASVTLETPDAFVRYWRRHKMSESVVFLQRDTSQGVLTFIAEFDYHHPDGDAPRAGWRDHRACYRVAPTKDWLDWASTSGQWLEQLPLAEFITDHVHSIHAADGLPSGADMLAVATTFEAKSEVTFSQAARLHDGAMQLTYDEQVAATTQTGKMRVPERFQITLAVFEGLDPVTIPVRFRFKLGRGQLAMRFDLHRPDLVLRAAFDAIATKLRAEIGESFVFDGIAAPAIR